MKKSEQLLIAIFMLCGTLTYICFRNHSFQSKVTSRASTPTENPRFSEEDGLHFLRREWWRQMHQTLEGIDWRQLEYQTQWTRYQRFRENLSFRSEEYQLHLLNGTFQGIWEERGSTNQAGSIYQTEYDADNDEIWLISAGGSLWKGSREGTDWTVVNQHLQFDGGLLKFIQYGGQKRLLALIGRLPHYSDDFGKNWQPAQGIFFEQESGSLKDFTILNDSTFFVLSQTAAGKPAGLYASTDGGRNFRIVYLFPIRDMDQIGIFLPFHSTHPLVALKKENTALSIYRINPELNTLDELPTLQPLRTGVIPVNLTGWHTDTLSRWYTYVEKNSELRLFQTNDQGKKWEDRGLLPAVPWEVGIKGSPSDPNLLFLGEVECYRSLNGGKEWKRINPWYLYYNDINNNLHADIMHFGEYATVDGIRFMLISHHGGLSYSEDFFTTQRNLGLNGLNITQYYDARTSPLNPNLVFAGSQDQGLQYNAEFPAGGSSPFIQLLPGDYDHLVFTQGGQSLWSVSPGGWVVYLSDAANVEITATWTLPNIDQSVWLPPISELPNSGKNQILLGGGSIKNGNGAFLIQLEANGFLIHSKQWPHDFMAASGGGLISALSVNPINNRWYVATTNGYFFYSDNQGENWSSPTRTGSQSPFFYSQTILPSRHHPHILYWGGAGYDQAAVYCSTDGGQSFSPFAEGLPPTVVFDLAANDEETFLFAATQAGPYLYSQAEGKWFDLSVPGLPVQIYLSVEFISSIQTVRFSTFGRGIWDLKLGQPLATHPSRLEMDWQLFPNPSNGAISLKFGQSVAWPLTWRIFTPTGQILQTGVIPPHQFHYDLNFSSLSPGVYFLQLEGKGKTTGRRLVIY